MIALELVENQTTILTECNNSRCYTCPAYFSRQQKYANGELDHASPYRVQLLNGEVDTFDVSGYEADRGCLLCHGKLNVQRLAIDDVDQ